MSIKVPGHEFDCSKLKDVLPDYLDRTLREQVCSEIKAHLEDCEDCRIYVETIETTIVLYKHCPDRDVPEEIRIDLRRSLRASIEQKRRGEDEF
jgi:predicted anti-sigma-YlaC factor YlaD